MQLFDICAKKEYETSGERRVKWYKIGILKITDSGKKYIRLFHMPQVDFFVFTREEQQQDGNPGSES